jgi:hypothetical protein
MANCNDINQQARSRKDCADDTERGTAVAAIAFGS